MLMNWLVYFLIFMLLLLVLAFVHILNNYLQPFLKYKLINENVASYYM